MSRKLMQEPHWESEGIYEAKVLNPTRLGFLFLYFVLGLVGMGLVAGGLYQLALIPYAEQGCELPPGIPIGTLVLINEKAWVVEKQIKITCGERWYECYLVSEPQVKIVASTKLMTLATK